MKHTISTIGIGAIALLWVCSCKDDDTNTKAATVNEQLAIQSAGNTIETVAALMDQNDGENAAYAMLTMGLDAQTLLVPEEPGQAAKLRPAVIRRALDGSGDGELTGTCECDEETLSCTFEDCGDAAGTLTMNGRISWNDGKLACDLTMSGSNDDMGTSMTYEVTLKSNLTVTETSINGSIDTTLSTDMTAEGTDVSVDVSSSVTYNKVTWDAVTYEPTGGSIDVSASMSGSASGENVTYEGSAHISF